MCCRVGLEFYDLFLGMVLVYLLENVLVWVCVVLKVGWLVVVCCVLVDFVWVVIGVCGLVWE